MVSDRKDRDREFLRAQKRHYLPENTSIIMPRLVCRDAAADMEFCLRTFNAEELDRRPGPDGSVAHGLLKISGEMIMTARPDTHVPQKIPPLGQ